MPSIYVKATGEALQRASVDAREILESAPELYSATPIGPKADEPDPLDHDLDGRKGGSKKRAKAQAAADDTESEAAPDDGQAGDAQAAVVESAAE